MQYSTIKDCQARFGWSPSTQYRFRKNHGLPHIVTPGGQVLYRDDLTDHWLEQFLKNTPQPQGQDAGNTAAKSEAEAMMASIIGTKCHMEDSIDE